MADFDIIIIGGGIAGASTAAFASAQARVLILEAEAQVGYHTTGRSAAFFSESYGGANVQPLSIASKSFLFHPPAGFADSPLLCPRGALHVARPGERAQAEALLRDYGPLAPALHMVNKADVDALAPMLKADWAESGVYDPACMDIDVHALHQGFLRQARHHGAQLITSARVAALQKDGPDWRAKTSAGVFSAPVVVNAAGAWGDALAALVGLPPLGLQPMQRTIITFAPTGYAVSPTSPLVLDVAGTFYFKPDGHIVWASPSDETPVAAADVQADELTVAITADRIQAATRYHIPHISRRWAGLRTFAPDRAPVFGFDPRAHGFFWCVGQGGFGIQTSVAAGMLCAALLGGAPLPEALLATGITTGRYAIDRLLHAR
jgi:D-arginine dehydrogenase